MKEKDYDIKGLADVQERAKALQSSMTTRRTLLETMEKIYFLDWDYKAPDQIKKTVSPDGRNKVQNGVRLLTATLPSFKLPREKNNPDVEEKASKMEKLAGIMFERSNNVQLQKIERDLALSGFVYDDMAIAIVCVEDVLEKTRRGAKEAAEEFDKKRWAGRVKKWEDIAAHTSYLLTLLNAKTIWPLFGIGGLEAVYIEQEKNAEEILSQWGADATEAVGAEKSFKKFTLCEWWDETFRYVWVQGMDKKPIMAEPHGLPAIPVVVGRAGGSRLFDKPEYQVEPFLYGYEKSATFHSQNLLLTAINTQVAATLNAQWVHTKGSPDAQISIDHTHMLGVVEVEQGGRLEPLMKDIVSKDVGALLNIFAGMADESTMFDQAFGAPAGSNAPYSLVALLSQSGRLPLVGIQTMMSLILGRAMTIIFKWMKYNGKSVKTYAQYGDELELKASDIPDELEFTCNVDVDLPQDKLQAANIVATLIDKGAASVEWLQSNFLNIENPEEMAKARWKEKAREIAGDQAIQQVLPALQQALAQMQPNPPAPFPAREGGEPGMMAGAQGGLPNAMMAAGGQGPQAARGQNPNETGELPPEMMNGGV